MIPDITTVQKINTDRHRGNVILALAETLGKLNNSLEASRKLTSAATRKSLTRSAEFYALHIWSLSEHLISLGDCNE